MEDAERDENGVPTLLALSEDYETDGELVKLEANPDTGALLCEV